MKTGSIKIGYVTYKVNKDLLLFIKNLMKERDFYKREFKKLNPSGRKKNGKQIKK